MADRSSEFEQKETKKTKIGLRDFVSFASGLEALRAGSVVFCKNTFASCLEYWRLSQSCSGKRQCPDSSEVCHLWHRRSWL